MQLERVIAALAPAGVPNRAPVEVSDLAYDARAVAPGALFHCVPGSRSDGHDFAADAVGRGAVALVVERELDVPVPQLVVPSVRAAMPVVADLFFGSPSRDLVVAGVTGTNGKTTTAFLIRSILEHAGLRPGLLGNVERRVGGESRPAALNTPEAIDLQRLFREMLDAGDRSVAMEASSHASEQHRLDCVRFDVLVFTNLTQDHLDFHGTMERYYEAKRRLFLGDEPPAAAINVDDPYGRRLAGELPAALTFGFADDADVRPDALADIDLKLGARFNVMNALGALAAGRLLGLDESAIRAGIEAVHGVPGRFEAVDEGQPFRVIVDFAHTPDSLENVLSAARELTQERVICVFGAGGDRDRGKRPKMGRAVAEGADVVIVTSDNPRTEDPLAIIDDIVAGTGPDAEIEPDRAAAIEHAVGLARDGDVVVIAGLSPEQGRHIGGRSFPWDDREIARAALQRLGAA
ncbi:MAG: UDP-N-acetylmuramoyl-L-alanyl-D-glutamate--2,6-diaminopimelate ligase [Gaiellaceae bacterium]|jgi:UDP-N-acetylmuramoyl-L-alanyl-D-glutamate--2,6-diaminopimelate ligase|nr:UDP-N-acetylmuramoyl-L-alanyl-D-glutamate--2,6-diaminopimelate ligase [Gaiellaceae bacterium]